MIAALWASQSEFALGVSRTRNWQEANMRDRRYLESKPNWQATFRRIRKTREKFVCLMRTVTGGYYWDTPTFKGLFWYGATKEYRQKDLQQALDEGLLILVKGQLPKGIKKG